MNITTVLGTPTATTKVIPRVWYTPAGIVDRITGSAKLCPEREYRTEEMMCWDCGEPRIVCKCMRGEE